MTKDLTSSREWMDAGTRSFLAALDQLDGSEEAYSADSLLPGWTRKHLIAHVSANADALCNLAHWAATGERTPMYASPEQRNADIERGSKLSAEELHAWAHRSAEELGRRLDGLSDEAWTAEVVTAQGRTVPASEVPWMRAREVQIHAVDLGNGASFEQMDAGFLTELSDEIAAKRSAAGNGPALELHAPEQTWTIAGTGETTVIEGPLFEIAAYLAGRKYQLTTAQGQPAPELPAWL